MRAHTPSPVPATAPTLPWLAPPTIAEPAVPTVTLDGSVTPDHAPILPVPAGGGIETPADRAGRRVGSAVAGGRPMTAVRS